MAARNDDIYDEALRDVFSDQPGRIRRLLGKGAFWSRAAAATFGLALLIVLYWEVGGKLMETIDDDLGFRTDESAFTEPGSRAVANAVALIERELEHGWTSNDPFFMPTYTLDNMPHYQQGIIFAMRRFSTEMLDQIGRLRGTSEVDADLQVASSKLGYSPLIYIFDLSSGLIPRPSSETEYETAAEHLATYNARLAAGEAVFEVRADSLKGMLDRIATDIGADAAAAANHAAEAGTRIWDTKVDDIYYTTKGRLFGYLIILRGLEQDFSQILSERGLDAVWAEMIGSLETASALNPLMIMNGTPDGLIVPNHLSAQGFALLQARAKLREVSDILRN